MHVEATQYRWLFVPGKAVATTHLSLSTHTITGGLLKSTFCTPVNDRMETQDFETSFKVVVVGNGNVGKSTLIRRFCKDQFIQSYKKTIGVEYLEREITVQVNEEEQSVRVMVWDCAGQEEFDKITQDYYQGIFVYSPLPPKKDVAQTD